MSLIAANAWYFRIGVLVFSTIYVFCDSALGQKCEGGGVFEDNHLVLKANAGQATLVLRFDVGEDGDWCFLTVSSSQKGKESLVCVIAVLRSEIDFKNERFEYSYSAENAKPIEVELALVFDKEEHEFAAHAQVGDGASQMLQVLCPTHELQDFDFDRGRLFVILPNDNEVRQIRVEGLSSPLSPQAIKEIRGLSFKQASKDVQL
jgi:hypothetical protein